LECVIGFLPFALTEETITSLRLLTFVVSFTFSCEKEKREKREKKIDVANFFLLCTLYFVLFLNKISIRKKMLRIKRGNYSLLKNKNVCFLRQSSACTLFCHFSLNSITCSRFIGYNLSLLFKAPLFETRQK